MKKLIFIFALALSAAALSAQTQTPTYLPTSGAPLSALGFGCVRNSTATADETANVACIQTMGNSYGKYYFPTGVYNLNSCPSISNNNGGFIFEGAGVAATSIIQQTSGICTLAINATFSNEFRIADMTIGHAVQQSPAASEGVNSVGPAVFLTGPAGASVFNFTVQHLAFTKSSRGVELDKTMGGTIWGYTVDDIRCNGDLTGMCLNFEGTGAGNPRIHMHRIFSTQTATTEPMGPGISQGGEVEINDIEDTPSSVPAATPITAYSTAGSLVTLTAANSYIAGQKVALTVSAGPTILNNLQYSVVSSDYTSIPAHAGTQFVVTQAGATGSGSATGSSLLAPWSTAMNLSGSLQGSTATHLHIENFTVSASGAPLIAGENSMLAIEDVSAAVNICPVGYACNAGSPVVYLASNIAGGGNLTLRNWGAAMYPTSNATATIHGMRSAGVFDAACSGGVVSSAVGTNTYDCKDPSSDIGAYTRVNNQWMAPASAVSAFSWAITSANNTSSGSTVYNGTFTGCPSSINYPTLTGRVMISGFVTNTVNNGYYKFLSCTSTTLTVVNGGGIAETHAATAVASWSSVGMPQSTRMWNVNTAATSTQTCTPTLVSAPNAAGTAWDVIQTETCPALPAGTLPWTQPMGGLMVWTNPSALDTLNYQQSWGGGLFLFGNGGSPGDSTGGIPVIRGYRNEGSPFFQRTDFRASGGLSGEALGEICPVASTGPLAIGTETAVTDQACAFMVNKNGWYSTGGLSKNIIPAPTAAAFNGPGAGGVQMSQTCTTASITPASTAGGTATGTCSLTASVTGHSGTAAATDGSVQGIVIPQVSVAGTTATVTLTTVIAGAPTAKTYNVTVF